MDNLEMLTKEQADLTAKAEKLTYDLEQCKLKMYRAEKMI